MFYTSLSYYKHLMNRSYMYFLTIWIWIDYMMLVTYTKFDSIDRTWDHTQFYQNSSWCSFVNSFTGWYKKYLDYMEAIFSPKYRNIKFHYSNEVLVFTQESNILRFGCIFSLTQWSVLQLLAFLHTFSFVSWSYLKV